MPSDRRQAVHTVQRPFGATPEERELIARLFATKQDVPQNAVSIDATAPIARVVDAILLRCGAADRGPD